MLDILALWIVWTVLSGWTAPPPAEPPPRRDPYECGRYGTDRERGEPGTGYESGPRGNLRR